MPVFDNLIYWRDATVRKAAENMAVDQVMMSRVGNDPILRIYDWSEPSVSFGYFHALEDARLAFPSSKESPVDYVRRWTGGGIVDHRIDLTYTLVVPRQCRLSQERGALSYRIIHQVLAGVLNALGQNVALSDHDDGDGSICFNNPVTFDLADTHGVKIAGAGQRRTRHGLLHQGSLLTDLDADLIGQEFACQLASKQEAWLACESFEKEVLAIAADRYATAAWLGKK